jgi:hypothetical protein
MIKYRRDIRGYRHIFLIEGFLLYDLLSENFLPTPIRLIGWIMFVVFALLTVRFISTSYLIVNDTKVIINRDFFFTTTIMIEEIDRIVFGKSLFVFLSGKIKMKDQSKTYFIAAYVSKDARIKLSTIAKYSQIH